MEYIEADGDDDDDVEITGENNKSIYEERGENTTTASFMSPSKYNWKGMKGREADQLSIDWFYN